ncbi:MAG: hypothetical protein JZU65_07640 [Chlorobium sp.]|nr:hypothetical protein [Chlorobium sp.]
MTSYRYYKSEDYILKPFYVHKIPECVIPILTYLKNNVPFAIMGGTAYAVIKNDMGKMINDMDLLVLDINRDRLINDLSQSSDELYLNKNYNGDSFVTLFWKTANEFYKVDLKLTDKIPETVEYLLPEQIPQVYYPVVSALWLWMDKLHKVASAELRGANEHKTLKQADFVVDLGKHIIGSIDKVILSNIDRSNLCLWLNKSIDWLVGKASKQLVQEFTDIATHILRIAQNT